MLVLLYLLPIKLYKSTVSIQKETRASVKRLKPHRRVYNGMKFYKVQQKWLHESREQGQEDLGSRAKQHADQTGEDDRFREEFSFSSQPQDFKGKKRNKIKCLPCSLLWTKISFEAKTG